MSAQSHSHAKDYLIQFSQDKPNWLRLLIAEAINSNGNISESKLSEIVSCLLSNDDVCIPNIQPAPVTSSSNFVLKTLEHISGVNALAPNQTVKFSDDVTVLFGLNGTGKSSYFRILNEIIGGNEEKEILSNSHKEVPDMIKAELTYHDSTDRKISFDGSVRGFAPLTACKVFDSSYLSGLLSQRTQTESVLEPLGLHLFQYIADTMTEIKRRLVEEADKLKNSKPTIKVENFSEQLANDFNDHSPSQQSVLLLKTNKDFSEDKKAELAKKQGELKILTQQNIQDRISVLKTENAEIQKVIDFLKKQEELEKLLIDVTKLSDDKAEKVRANKAALERIAVLKELPLVGTEEWKDFISAGAKLQEKQKTDEDVCIYCRQPLQSEAVKLVQAYGNYLNDESEKILESVKKVIKQKKTSISNFSVELLVSDDFKKILEETHRSDDPKQSLWDILESIQKSYQAFKEFLLHLADGNEEKRLHVCRQFYTQGVFEVSACKYYGRETHPQEFSR